MAEISSVAEISDAKKMEMKLEQAQKLIGGTIIEVSTPEQANLAEAAGACAVMVSEPPAQDRPGILRMPNPFLIKDIKKAVTIPVMARCRIGHVAEAQILEAIGVDFIDESESLTVVDKENPIDKQNFQTPFICGSRSLGEALMNIRKGASMIRIQGDLLSSGDISDTVKNVRSLTKAIGNLKRTLDDNEVIGFSKKLVGSFEIFEEALLTKKMGRLHVVQFAAGGIVTPADASLLMQMGCDGVFVGSEIFQSSDRRKWEKRLCGIVQAVKQYKDPFVLVESSSRF
ncbi:pyridoxal 5'-phosphate synthase-like subunit PDX1.2 [Ziziphus jujuba]|uniref:Pyridoxal 5'-phosphate synthase-like subunit PDX1.2 n=1 Tax=Ziziphus jujuba TaxID=326968 RepID=A0A6P3YUN0_ZIZJJ|nr:pyridoxal 5'-phosphate synthase-like subunit PDX1.2 [Ziziphus jujuba]